MTLPKKIRRILLWKIVKDVICGLDLDQINYRHFLLEVVSSSSSSSSLSSSSSSSVIVKLPSVVEGAVVLPNQVRIGTKTVKCYSKSLMSFIANGYERRRNSLGGGVGGGKTF